MNTYRAMSPMSPRQGFKNSGVGIEHGLESMNEYTRLKSVWINTSEDPVADRIVEALRITRDVGGTDHHQETDRP